MVLFRTEFTGGLVPELGGSTGWTADQLVQTRNEHMYVLFTRIRRI